MTESHSNGLSALLTVSRSAAVCVPLITECIDYPGPPRVPIMSPDTSDTLPPPSAAVGGDRVATGAKETRILQVDEHRRGVLLACICLHS
jgi:hypothetical protein